MDLAVWVRYPAAVSAQRVYYPLSCPKRRPMNAFQSEAVVPTGCAKGGGHSGCPATLVVRRCCLDAAKQGSKQGSPKRSDRVRPHFSPFFTPFITGGRVANSVPARPRG